MSGTEWGVVVGAATAIAWVNWYFFVAGRAPMAAAIAPAPASLPAAGDVAELVITVDGGYDPNTVRVKAGRRVRLVFERKDNSSCSEEVVLPEFGVRRFLPSGERTSIEITAREPGRYPFTCGMSMLRGTIIVDA